MAKVLRRRPYGYAPRRLHRHRHLRFAGIGMLAGASLVTLGIYVALSHVATESRYRALARSATYVVPATDSPGNGEASPGVSETHDWRQLLETNADVGAWIRVEGTSIDLPVMVCGEHDGSYYLCHDLWGNYAFEGVPFLDHRCDPTSMHRLVFGHRLAMGGQFSELQKAYEQEVFDKLGACRWYLPDGTETVLQPAFSLSVDMWFEEIQRFDFEDHGQLRAWLIDLSRQATATSAACESLLSEATSVVTLVTCSSDYGHQEWRTLTVFVASGEAPVAHDAAASP